MKFKIKNPDQQKQKIRTMVRPVPARRPAPTPPILAALALLVIGPTAPHSSLAFTIPHQSRGGAPSTAPHSPALASRSTTAVWAKKKPTKKKPKKAGGGGAGFGAKAPTAGDELILKALRAKTTEVKSGPTNARSWLDLGSVLVKRGDYAEAEEAFRIGDLCAPGDEMLHGAYVAVAGHSDRYFGGDPSGVDPAATDCPFDTYEVGQPAEDFRTVSWTARGDRPRVQVSKGPLLPRDECAWAIEEAERHANENGGWTSARHTQAATTDMPVKDIPKLLDWFNAKLETTLFPMLASRYPDKITSVADLRAHDSFIVKYDAEGKQNSLVTHVDESAFSFTIALNDREEYEGGGTCFEAIRLEKSKAEYEPLTLNADAGGGGGIPGHNTAWRQSGDQGCAVHHTVVPVPT